jgi:thiol:disulfide interchange protein
MKKIIYFVPLFAIAVILLALLVFGLFHQQSPDTEFKTVDITHFDHYDNASGSMVQGAILQG